MLVAGEIPKNSVEPFSQPVPISAIIALSPFADFSGSPLSTRYQSITLPVLSVTGDADTDTVEAVPSPSVRKAPFEYMPSKNAFLLWLTNTPHTLFSGTGFVAEDAPAKTATDSRADNQNAHKGGSRLGGKGSSPSSPSVTGEGSYPGEILGSASLTDRAMSASLVQGVTTAFLDAYLKGDSIAKEWLQKDANRWIGNRGELKWK